MISEFFSRVRHAALVQWPLLAIGITLSLLGILTMHPFGSDESFAPRQLLFVAIGVAVYLGCSIVDMSFMRRNAVIITSYFGVLVLLIALLLIAHPVLGARAWFVLGPFSFQPADLAKIVFIAVLAKYFSRRHVEIRHVWHVVLSGIYAAIPIFLILIQPDMGTAVILSAVWFGMVLFSGISKKHLTILFVIGAVAGTLLWSFGLHEYQKTRIMTFLNPAADIHGSGYNAYQAMVATGSGELFGKGIGYGTQSKLRFLPEYETDFIFASFAEEWGFVGVVLVLVLYGLLLFQLLRIAQRSATNFDAFFTIGVVMLFFAHLFIHVGINVGILPVTGTTIPFMSYGGSHVLMEFALLGIVASLSGHGRGAPRSLTERELLS